MLSSPLRSAFLACAVAVLLLGCRNEGLSPSSLKDSETALDPTCQPVLDETNAGAARVDEYFRTLAERGMFNGSVLVALGEDVVLRQAYIQDEAIEGLRVSPCDQFIIASVSKLLIKYAVLTLQQQGRLSLTDPIETYVAGIPAGEQITIQQLLDHQSGLPRELNGVEDLGELTQDAFVELARQEKLEFEPGTDTKYSNVAYQLLVSIIDRASPDGYDQFMVTSVYQPLGLVRTAEYASAPHDHLARAFDTEGEAPKLADTEDLNRFSSLRHMSTVDDLFRFGRGVFDEKATHENITRAMLGDKAALTHAGSLASYRSYLRVEPEAGLSFIFLANVDSIPFLRITEDIAKIMAGEPYEIPVRGNRIAVAVAPGVLEAYVGRFVLELDPDQWFDVQMGEDGGLLVVDSDDEQTQLFAESETTFFSDSDSDDSIEFEWNEELSHYTMTLIVEGGMRLATSKVVDP